jgi:hypothetical protein
MRLRQGRAGLVHILQDRSWRDETRRVEASCHAADPLLIRRVDKQTSAKVSQNPGCLPFDRQRSSTFAPASFSFSIAMICSSLNRLCFIEPSSFIHSKAENPSFLRS